ncbi:MAG: glycosyltransferase [Alphaproteobacteria bacterium]|nr:glycosyltransferase [Alphaproteobacteria bacterium]
MPDHSVTVRLENGHVVDLRSGQDTAGPDGRVSSETELPAVSIVVNTLDRADSLDRTLIGLRQLRYPNFEVVVVQGPCADATGDVLARHADAIRIGHCHEANLSMSRNIGIAMAKGEIIAFIDDDAVPEPDWLDHLVAAFKDPAVGAVGGFIRNPGGIRFQYQVVIADRFGAAMLKQPGGLPDRPGQYVSPTGTSVAIRRAALLAIGGFDEEYAYFLDETDVNLRLLDAGWRLALIPDAEVHHKFAQNQVRGADRVPQSMYLIARSKSYFCWTNAVKVHSAAEIERHLLTFSRMRTSRIRSLRDKGRIDAQTCQRLIAEIGRGLRDGAHDARTQATRSLLTENLIRSHEPAGFKRYPASRPAEARMRLCLLSRAYPPFSGDEIGRWTRDTARALTARGHEVTVICLSPHRHAFVDFIDGVWVHGLLNRRFLADLRAKMPPAARIQFSYRVAVAQEIARIQARRNLQLICSPLVDLEAAVAVRRTGLPSVLTLHAARQTPRPFVRLGLWPNGGARGYAIAKAKLIASASLIFEDTDGLFDTIAPHAHLAALAGNKRPAVVTAPSAGTVEDRLRAIIAANEGRARE